LYADLHNNRNKLSAVFPQQSALSGNVRDGGTMPGFDQPPAADVISTR
jgi:hypothetical protein